jgi:hypothetical protein
MTLKNITCADIVRGYAGKLTPTILELAAAYACGKTPMQRKMAKGFKSGEIRRVLEKGEVWWVIPGTTLKTLPRSCKGLTLASLNGTRGEASKTPWVGRWDGMDYGRFDVQDNDNGRWPPRNW